MLKAEERTYIPEKVCASYGILLFLKGNSEYLRMVNPKKASPSGIHAYPIKRNNRQSEKKEK